MSAFREAAARSPLLRGLAQLTGHVVRRRNHVVFELDLTLPREPTAWAPGERVIEIGPENIDTAMTPELLAFLGGAAWATSSSSRGRAVRGWCSGPGTSACTC